MSVLENVSVDLPMVLIVDDQPDPLLLSERQLRQLQPGGVQRQSVRSLAEAAQILNHWAQDFPTLRVILVLDLMFPTDANDGLDFLSSVSRRRIRAPHMTRVIVRSGLDDLDVVARACELGALGFVRKGDDPERLLEAVRYACGGEVLVAKVLCEVIDVDSRQGTVRVAIDGREGWTAERSFDASWCPPAARLVGGAFHAETYKRLTDRGPEIVLRSAAVDEAEEAAALAELFRPI